MSDKNFPAFTFKPFPNASVSRYASSSETAVSPASLVSIARLMKP